MAERKPNAQLAAQQLLAAALFAGDALRPFYPLAGRRGNGLLGSKIFVVFFNVIVYNNAWVVRTFRVCG